MKKVMVFSVAMIFCLLLAVNLGAYPDPGEPDTVKLEGGPLILGQSVPISLTIVNDEPLGGYALGFLFGAESYGFARFDSVVYVGRMADPSVLSWRILSETFIDNVPADTLVLGAQQLGYNYLPEGNTPVAELYFTGMSPGVMTLDSTFFPPAGDFALTISQGEMIIPRFQQLMVAIFEGTAYPSITISQENSIISAGETLNLDVEADSPADFQIVSFTGYDDNTMQPANQATIGEGNPAEISWTPTSADVGIWEMKVKGCNNPGRCDTASAIIQVLESGDFILDFGVDEIESDCYSTGLLHGNFDMDQDNEIYVGDFFQRTGELFHNTAAGWESSFIIDDMRVGFGPRAGYFDDDECLDIIQMVSRSQGIYRVKSYKGNCNGNLEPVEIENDGAVTRNCAMGELTGDNYLDYVSAWLDGIQIFAGDGNYHFTHYQTLNPSNQSLTVNCADFNADGMDDLAVGTTEGLVIYLNDGNGSFIAAYSYPQTYGSVDIEVANQGSDFNADNIFDLCISTPSVGGEESEMVVYLGNGDGSFAGTPVRTFKGQIFGNCIGDFNNDHMLDIAYVNCARRYVGILFGDDTGEFSNEIRYQISHRNLRFIDCFDADLDGDLDLIVSGNDMVEGNYIYILSNLLNPPEFRNKPVAISGLNNADLQLNSSAGDVLNKYRNTMPDGAYFRRNIDSDQHIDDYITMNSVESGEYTLKATAKPNVQDGEKFGLEFELDGTKYRLAKEMDASESGYEFSIYLDQSPITPVPGSFVKTGKPQLSWEGEGDFDIELASDIEFQDVIEVGLVQGNSFTPETDLDTADTATYYWRVKAHADSEFGKIYVFNVAAGPVGVDDGSSGQTLPDKFELFQNYPNPFNPSTSISYSLPVDAHVNISIFNILGQKIQTLVDEEMIAGNHSIIWDGKTSESKSAASGIYFYRIKAGDFVKTMKMILQK